jgi:hypothetical protein
MVSSSTRVPSKPFPVWWWGEGGGADGDYRSVFNGGAPWNQEAGRTWGSQLETVREHLEAQREEYVHKLAQKQKH